MVGHPGSLYHRVRIASVYLDSDRSLRVGSLHFLIGFPGVPDQSLGRDEFGVHHVGSLLAAYSSEGCVGNVLHRGQEHRLVSEVYIAYSHRCSASFLQK